MKKTYIAPALYVHVVQAEVMIAASITRIGGDSGIGMGDANAPIPDDADVKGNFYGESIFDE